MAIDPSAFFTEQVYGADAVTQQGLLPQVYVNYGLAILVITGFDGELSELELSFFLARSRAFGTPERLLEEYRSFDPASVPLEELVPPLREHGLGPALIYDAVLVASVDGYHPDERAAVRRAAELVGVDPPTVVAIEGLVEVEHALTRARHALLAPKPRR